MSNPIVGSPSKFGLVYLDQFGKPMTTTPVPDAPPNYASVTSGTFVAVPPDMTNFTPSVAGADTISVSATIGGKVFTASLAITVDSVAQVLTSISIVPLL